MANSWIGHRYIFSLDKVPALSYRDINNMFRKGRLRLAVSVYRSWPFKIIISNLLTFSLELSVPRWILCQLSFWNRRPFLIKFTTLYRELFTRDHFKHLPPNLIKNWGSVITKSVRPGHIQWKSVIMQSFRVTEIWKYCIIMDIFFSSVDIEKTFFLLFFYFYY